MAMTKLQFYFLVAGCAFMALFASIVPRILPSQEHGSSEDNESTGFILATLWFLVSATCLLIIFTLALVCFHISYLRASKYHTVKSILFYYIGVNFMCLFYGIVMRKFNKRAKNLRYAQEMFLKDRMQQNAKTVYGKQYDFSNIKCLEDLRNKHPLTEYAHYEDYIQRMANGEKDVLISEELQRFGITSGTTGKGKLIPLPKSRFWKFSPVIECMWQDAIIRRIGSKSVLQRDIITYVNPQPTTTPSGEIVGPMHLYTDDLKWMMSLAIGVPWEVTSITTEHEAHYLMLLFGLRDVNIGSWMGPFSSQIHKAMSRLEKHWRRLVHDIKTGTVNEDLRIAPEVREVCIKNLTPEPQRAEELTQEFEKGFDGIMRRVWPHLSFVIGINTSDYTKKLRNGYAKGVPIVSPFYASTEGDYGVNLWPDDEDDKYVLLPNTALYEFIQEDEITEDQPSTLFIDEVQKGQSYELVISPVCGFYRYRFGDVIKVVDFYYNVPVVKFMYRSGQLLNLRAEKVTEISVDEAVHHMVDNLPGAKLVNWTSAESTVLPEQSTNYGDFDEGAQFYFVFVELDGNSNIRGFNDESQQQFDTALQERNNYYKGYRKAGTISPPRVYLVKPGTFKVLQDFIVANSTASYNQLKLPCKLKTAATFDLVMESKVQSS